MPHVSEISEDEWNSLLNRISPERADVYYTPEYMYLYQYGTSEGRVVFTKYEEGNEIVLYPYLEREIPNILSEDGLCRKDVITPYGYGGPISTNYSLDFLTNFNEALDDYFAEKGYVSEFVRFHPLLENHRLRKCETVFIHETFGVDFRDNFSDDLAFWKDSIRRGAKKAKKNGLIFEINQINEHNLYIFVNLYLKTMKRRNARKFYFFSDEYWKLLLNLGKREEAVLASVLFKGRVIASAIFLLWKNIYIHYHLGGSDKEFLYLRPNNFLFWNAEKWAYEKGFSLMHIGGGVTKNDGLERFKRGISNKSFKFYIGKKIIGKDCYEMLNRAALRINDKQFNDSFFPSYRSIFLSDNGVANDKPFNVRRLK